jgi:hypothetical protein
MVIVDFNAALPPLVGILVWSLLMLGIELGNAMSEAFAHRRH